MGSDRQGSKRTYKEIGGGSRDSSKTSVDLHIWIPAEIFWLVDDLARNENIPISRKISQLIEKGLGYDRHKRPR